MQFKFLAPLALAAAAAADYSNDTSVHVVTDFTTYCPESTTFLVNNKTYEITSATTLTITNCPCTIKPVPTAPASSKAPAPASKTTLATSAPASSKAPALSTATGAAAKAGVAGLAAVAGAVAYLL